DTEHDFLLTRGSRTAGSSSGDAALFISNEPAPNGPSVGRALGLPSRFGYLGDGDIIAVHPKTKRFRTLYRRSSHHNSFLVTERCNHYCLMCSQPPKDIDDRWILNEIREAIPLILPDTESLGFTGGEPLLEWRDFLGVLALCRDHLPRTAVHV